MNAHINLVGYMAKNYAALRAETQWNAAAGCREPSVSEGEASLTLSTAEVTQRDIADALQVVSQLLVNYPDNIGDESELLPQVGQLLRVLGGVLDLANDVAECAENQQYSHDMLSRVKPVQASQADKTPEDIAAQETLHQMWQVMQQHKAAAKTSTNEEEGART